LNATAALIVIPFLRSGGSTLLAAAENGAIESNSATENADKFDWAEITRYCWRAITIKSPPLADPVTWIEDPRFLIDPWLIARLPQPQTTPSLSDPAPRHGVQHSSSAA
jgi:hypothetical protein